MSVNINSEDELKQKIGISSWRELTKDKFLQYIPLFAYKDLKHDFGL